MFKKVILIIIIILLAAVGAVVFYFFNQISQPASDSADEVIFSVKKGEGVKVIASNLEKQGLVKNPFLFNAYVYLDGSEAKFIAGDYLLKKNYNIKELVKVFISGKVTNERVIKIIEGWTKNEIAEYLEKESVVAEEDFLEAADVVDSRKIIPDKNYNYLADKPAKADLEGFLFPDTYRVFKDSTSAQIIEKMLDNFGVKFTEQMRTDVANGKMTVFQIVALASVIEAEVKIDLDESGQPVNNDHYIVAGIFYNRLNSGMPLESDATINYITSGDNPQPTSDELSIDSPYNTYKYTGLPPGPIGNPSLEAIKAAIYPEETDYLYFLHKINDDGSIVFSQTYQEHLENKAKYLN